MIAWLPLVILLPGSPWSVPLWRRQAQQRIAARLVIFVCSLNPLHASFVNFHWHLAPYDVNGIEHGSFSCAVNNKSNGV
jgi:hypothetical protein